MGLILHALIGPGIVVAIFGLILLVAWLGAFRKSHPSPLFRPLDLLPSAMAWGFVAMMFAVAGGALYPPIVAKVASPFVCESGIETRSREYSYKPGQADITRNLLCVGPDGEPRDVTLASIAVATLVYTLAGLAFSMLRSLWRKARGESKRADGL